MKKWMAGALALLVAGGAQARDPQVEDTGAVASTGDALLIGLPVAAFGLTYLLHGPDKDAGASTLNGSVGGIDFVHMTGSPRHDLGLALLRTEAITFGLKAVVAEDRPTGEPHSFPSAHTSTTFAAAEFVRKEYGWTWGMPAYLAAGFAGYSRIEAKEHWTQDVLAGAAIGILSNHDVAEFHGWRIAPGFMGVRRQTASGDEATPGVAPGLNVEMKFGK